MYVLFSRLWVKRPRCRKFPGFSHSHRADTWTGRDSRVGSVSLYLLPFVFYHCCTLRCCLLSVHRWLVKATGTSHFLEHTATRWVTVEQKSSFTVDTGPRGIHYGPWGPPWAVTPSDLLWCLTKLQPSLQGFINWCAALTCFVTVCLKSK